MRTRRSCRSGWQSGGRCTRVASDLGRIDLELKGLGTASFAVENEPDHVGALGDHDVRVAQPMCVGLCATSGNFPRLVQIILIGIDGTRQHTQARALWP